MLSHYPKLKVDKDSMVSSLKVMNLAFHYKYSKDTSNSRDLQGQWKFKRIRFEGEIISLLKEGGRHGRERIRERKTQKSSKKAKATRTKARGGSSVKKKV